MEHHRVNKGWLLLGSAIVCVVLLLAKLRAAGPQDFATPTHMTTDWSSRHLVYSGQPKGPNGWAAMQDPRYRRHRSIYEEHGEFAADGAEFNEWRVREWRRYWPFRSAAQPSLRRDWQFSMGPNALTGSPNNDFSFPAKFTFDINAAPSCTNDFVVFTTGLAGATGGQASIVALNQLYSGTGLGGTGICGTGQPSVMWAYKTGLAGDNNGVNYTSPVLSFDGTKVAFVEYSANGFGGAILKILKWVAGQGTVSAAVAPTPITSGSPWSTCPATGTSCLFSLAFSGGSTDVQSSPFYDYTADNLYVGDDGGRLHKFTGVFKGTPAEVTTGGWPFSIGSGNYITGPVYDSVSGNIFAADGLSSLHYIRDTGSTVGTCASGSPPCIGTPSLLVSDVNGIGVFDPPTVDQTSQRVFVFTSYSPTDNAAVVQANTALGAAVDTPFQGSYNNIYSGAFDKNYNSGSYSTGFLYACGTNPLGLYRIGFNSAGVMNSTAAAGSVNLELSGDSGTYCSPITEILNGSNDYLFFGLQDLGSPAGCSNGCLLGLNLTGMTWPPAVSAFSVLPMAGGTSGIAVDNVGTGGQESNVYFGPQSNNCTSPAGNGCAVKATQSGLN